MLDVKFIRIESIDVIVKLIGLSNIHTKKGRIHRTCNNDVRPNHPKAYLQKYILIIDS